MGAHLHFLLFAAVIALGYAMKRLKVLSEDDAGPLSRVILNVTLPAVVFKSFLDFRFEASLLLLPLAVVLFGGLMFALSRPLARGGSRGERTLFTVSLLGFNMGLFAYPIIEAVYGARALGLMVLADCGNAMIIFGLAYVICVVSAAGHGRPAAEVARTVAVRLFTFIPFLSFIAALALGYMGFEPGEFGRALLDVLSRANMALVLVLLGITFSAPSSWKEARFIAAVLGLRYGAGIAAGLAAYMFFPLGGLERLMLAVTLVLPVGMAIIPYAIEFGLSVKSAAAVVNASNIVSIGILYAVTTLVPPGTVTSFRF